MNLDKRCLLRWAIAFVIIIASFVLRWQFPVNIGANDGSRWNTVWSLSHRGTYEVSGAPFETVDVLEVRRDGANATYSSKPPFFSTWVAYVYRLLRLVWPLDIARSAQDTLWVLLWVNGLPFLWFLQHFFAHVERSSTSRWTRNFLLVTASSATFLSGYLWTLNNHLMAAILVYASFMLWSQHIQSRSPASLAWSGFFAAIAVFHEVSALIFPLVILLHFAAMRRAAECKAFALQFIPLVGLLMALEWRVMGYVYPRLLEHVLPIGDTSRVMSSYFLKPIGIDAARDPWWLNLGNMTFGHHGFFSMTPVFLLAVPHIVRVLKSRHSDVRDRQEHLIILLTSALLTALLTWKTNNYGGVAHGMRWMFWLIPLWLILLAPAVEKFVQPRRWARSVALIFLLVSFVNVALCFPNPWTHSIYYRDTQ